MIAETFLNFAAFTVDTARTGTKSALALSQQVKNKHALEGKPVKSCQVAKNVTRNPKFRHF